MMKPRMTGKDIFKANSSLAPERMQIIIKELYQNIAILFHLYERTKLLDI